jgi:uncharacterized protein YaaR (DUF327 family)
LGLDPTAARNNAALFLVKAMPVMEHLYQLASEGPPLPPDFFQFNIGQVAQVVVVLFGFGVMFQQLRGDIKNQKADLVRIEADVAEQMKNFETKLDKMSDFKVSEARQDERLKVMDDRILSQGQRLDALQSQTASRLDSYAVLISGRLEAINNIISGHTAQLGRRGQPPT